MHRRHRAGMASTGIPRNSCALHTDTDVLSAGFVPATNILLCQVGTIIEEWPLLDTLDDIFFESHQRFLVGKQHL